MTGDQSDQTRVAREKFCGIRAALTIHVNNCGPIPGAVVGQHPLGMRFEEFSGSQCHCRSKTRGGGGLEKDNISMGSPLVSPHAVV